MKLAFVRQRYTDFGGAERYIHRLAGLIAEKGHEVHLLAREWTGDPREGFQFIRIRSLGGPVWIRQPAFGRAVAREVARGGYDLVQGFDRIWSQDVYRAGDGCHAEFLARRARVQGWGRKWLDRLSPRHWALLAIERRMFSDPRLRVVLANSQTGKEEIIRWYGLGEDRIRVVYNGVDRVRFHPGLRDLHRSAVRKELGLEADEPAALFVGSGFLRKGLAEVARALEHSSMKVLVAGKDRPEPFERLAAKAGSRNRLVFLGPRKDVDRLLGAVDLFVLPSWYEPFSNACLEAMAAGLPLVTTLGTGAAETVTNGVNGFRVPFPVHPEALAAAMDQALALDRSRLIGHNDQVLQAFDWDKNVADTLAAYETALGRPL